MGDTFNKVRSLGDELWKLSNVWRQDGEDLFVEWMWEGKGGFLLSSATVNGVDLMVAITAAAEGSMNRTWIVECTQEFIDAAPPGQDRTQYPPEKAIELANAWMREMVPDFDGGLN